VVLDQRGSGTVARDSKPVTSVLGGCILVCGADEREDKFVDGIEELLSRYSQSSIEPVSTMLMVHVCDFAIQPRLTSSTSSTRFNGFRLSEVPFRIGTVIPYVTVILICY